MFQEAAGQAGERAGQDLNIQCHQALTFLCQTHDRSPQLCPGKNLQNHLTAAVLVQV